MAEVTTRPAQGCSAGGQAPAENPYGCDRCDLAETGMCGKADAGLGGNLTTGDLAAAYRNLAMAGMSDTATTYTDDELFEAATMLHDVLGGLLRAADAIRDSRLVVPEQRIHRL